jgi:hypothetical protein
VEVSAGGGALDGAFSAVLGNTASASSLLLEMSASPSSSPPSSLSSSYVSPAGRPNHSMMP